VYCPLSFVVRERVTPVSIEVASTRAPTIGFPSGDVILPVMMSVVLPTCAPTTRVTPTDSRTATNATSTDER